MASRSVLARNGLTQETFAAGKHVTNHGQPSAAEPDGLRGARSTLRRWQRAARLDAVRRDARDDGRARTAQRESIEGVWAMKRFAVSRYIGALTEEGERLRAAFDPIKDDPAIYCDPASPVRFWVNVNEPFEIKREGDAVVVDHQFMDTPACDSLERDGSRRRARRAARWATRRAASTATRSSSRRPISSRRRSSRATPSCTRRDLKLTERIEVNAQTHELEITWTIDDPVVFKEPHTQKEIFVRTERWREPYNCKPGYQQ